jgi:hypothetical protein
LGNKVYELNIEDTIKPSTALITELNGIDFYGIGIDSNHILYLADAKGFQGNGKVYRYWVSGDPIDNFSVGIGPNGFAFR